MTTKRIFFSVGEPSGDLHASNLILDLNKLGKESDIDDNCVQFEFTGFGGPKMAAVGCDLFEDLTQHAVMFLSGVISKYAKFKRLLKNADQVFKSNQVDLVVLIDYSGFNWHVAKAAKKHGIPVVFYGIPQMWAWAPWRVRKMRRNVDLGICKLPFEKKWLEDRNCKAEYVGHPFFDEMERQTIDLDFVSAFKRNELQSQYGSGEQADLVTILPGSRVQEIKNCLPVFLRTADKISAARPNTKFVISCLNDEQQKIAFEIQASEKVGVNIPVIGGKTPELVQLAKCCLACSGSVSLELMYREKPTVIYYRLPTHFYMLQKLFLRIKYITLVNLLWSKSIKRTGTQVYDPDSPTAEQVPFPEYLTTQDKSKEMASQITGMLDQPGVYESYRSMLKTLKQMYGDSGASSRAASTICQQFFAMVETSVNTTLNSKQVA